MIVVAGSALFAVLLGEDEGGRCRSVLSTSDALLVSAGSLAETLIVAARKDVLAGMQRILDGLAMTVVPLTEERALAAAAGYRRWGKSFDPAALNICDSFAYALAKERDCALLFVSKDFSQTDIRPALAAVKQ